MPTDETRQFVAHIREYDDVLRNAADMPTDEMLRQLIRTLSRLIESATHLPDMERPSSDTEEHDIGLPDAPEDNVRELINVHLSFDLYWSADPASPDPSLWTNSLFEDLCDTWADIHWGLEMLKVGAEASEARAVALWRQMFVSHWGRHAAEALRALMYIESHALR